MEPSASPRALPGHVRPFAMSRAERIGWIVFAVLAAWAASRIDPSWARFVTGLANAERFFDRMLPPIFTPERELVRGLAESLQIAVLATALGLALSLPLGLLAARNLMPGWVSWSARFVITVCRTFHPVIVAIVFVKAVGFGALAGIFALTVASIGFVGKLFAEAIEEISMKPIEAGYWPQVKPAFWAIVLLRWDINVRESAVLGLVGAGGIGVALNTAMNLFQWQRVAVVLLAIFAVVIVAEVLVTQIRKRLI